MIQVCSMSFQHCFVIQLHILIMLGVFTYCSPMQFHTPITNITGLTVSNSLKGLHACIFVSACVFAGAKRQWACDRALSSWDRFAQETLTLHRSNQRRRLQYTMTQTSFSSLTTHTLLITKLLSIFIPLLYIHTEHKWFNHLLFSDTFS